MPEDSPKQYLTAQPKPEWAPLPRPGCRHVQFRVLLNRDDLLVANLQFGTDAEIDEHGASYDIDVICISGSGYVSIGGEQAEVSAGQTIHWPSHKNHKLWTSSATMETIMIERIYQKGSSAND